METISTPFTFVSDPMSDLPSQVLVVGGGRWAQVHCRVLHTFGFDIKRIHVVSTSNSTGMRQWIDSELDVAGDPMEPNSERFTVWSSLDELLAEIRPNAAVIANHPDQHYETAARLLSEGVNVLIEKPAVAATLELDRLMALAEENDCIAMVGHEFLQSSYVHYLAESVDAATKVGQPVVAITSRWHDVFNEERHGLAKLPDFSTNVASDLLPHILSIASVVFGPQPIEVLSVNSVDGGINAEVALRIGSTPMNISLSRSSEQTVRDFVVAVGSDDDRNQTEIALDFSSEPGQVYVDGSPQPVDPGWDVNPRPLNSEWVEFFSAIATVSATESRHHQLSLEANRPIIEACIEVDRRIGKAQAIVLEDWLASDQPSDASFVSLRQNLAAPLLRAGALTTPKDPQALDAEVARASQVIAAMANEPFTTQQRLVGALGIDRDHLLALNRALRASPVAQRLMLHSGSGSKYFTNTLLPMIRSGAVRSALESEYRYPTRVGMYAGQSCMFDCSFCGRNTDALYLPSKVAPGNELLKQIFSQAPKDDPYRFYLSGGLEPLTNRGLGDLVSHGAQEGFRLSLYTNGYLLNRRLLEAQEGLWDLASLRISLYGVDKSTTAEVTRVERSFDKVIANAGAFLAMRNERGSDLQFGFNFVLLTNRSQQLLDLAELLAELNSTAGGRQIDFLTLREDYSVAPGGGIGRAEREELISTIEEFETRRKASDLKDLKVDYGYSLEALRQGRVGRPLEMVTEDDMWPTAYPQISVVVDLLGDVYAYREAGFLDRPGADRYILNRVSPDAGLDQVIKDFVSERRHFEARAGDVGYFDSYDHVVTKLLRQAAADEEFGIPFDLGPIADRSLATERNDDRSDFANAHFHQGADEAEHLETNRK